MKSIFAFLLCLVTFFLSHAQSWTEVDNGLDLAEYSDIELFSYDKKLFAGGFFTSAGNNQASGIAYWDDRRWINFTSDTIAFRAIRSFVVYKNELYGMVSYFDLFNYSKLVKFDKEKQHWTIVPNSELIKTANNGNSYSGYISKAIEYKGELIVAGRFDKIGDTTISSSLAKWDGEQWSSVFDENDTDIYISQVTDLQIYQGILFISGSNFHFNDVSSFNGIVQYDGEHWNTLEIRSSGSNIPHITQLEVYKGSLYAAGRGSTIPNDDQSYWVTKWDGQEWKGLDDFRQYDLDENLKITALKTYGNHLVIGGTNEGTVAFYNGDTTIYSDQKLNGKISTFEVYNSQLYASGYFFGPTGEGVSRLANLTGVPFPQSSFLLFPNPTNGNLLIEYEIENNSRVIVEILHASGKLVFAKHFNELEGKYIRHLDLKDLPAGSYIIKLQSKNFNQSKVFIKQ